MTDETSPHAAQQRVAPQEVRRIEAPSLGGIYLRAGLGAARGVLPSRSRAGAGGPASDSAPGSAALPDHAVVARHPGASAEKVEDYRRLFGGEVFDGAHRRGLPSVLVHILGFPVQMALLGGPGFPLPLMGMVHLSNAVEHRRPVDSGTPLQIRAWAEGLRAHRRGTQFDAVVEVLTEDADPSAPDETDILWRGVSTYLSRGVHLAGREEGDDPAARGSRTGRQEFTPPAKTGQWRLGADAGRRYAAVSGDWNPIHISGLSARALGMPRAIVHGMYAAGRMLEGREPEQAGHRWSIRFEAPMRLPGTVAFHAHPGGSELSGDEAPDSAVETFVGWDPRSGRRHFAGELVVPA